MANITYINVSDIYHYAESVIASPDILPVIELIILSFFLALTFSIFANSLYDILKVAFGIEKENKKLNRRRLVILCVLFLAFTIGIGYYIYSVALPHGIEALINYLHP